MTSPPSPTDEILKLVEYVEENFPKVVETSLHVSSARYTISTIAARNLIYAKCCQ